jgi:hypothetical protein
MAWLFERTIECAAWVAMIVAWVSAVLGVYWFAKWCNTLQLDFPDYALLRQATWAATSFVGFSVALGVLACIDRFIFDAADAGQKG